MIFMEEFAGSIVEKLRYGYTNAWVYVNRQVGWLNVDDVTYISTEETPYGDAMIFEYNGAEYQSNVVHGEKP